jgi:hypothetical protein
MPVCVDVLIRLATRCDMQELFAKCWSTPENDCPRQDRTKLGSRINIGRRPRDFGAGDCIPRCYCSPDDLPPLIGMSALRSRRARLQTTSAAEPTASCKPGTAAKPVPTLGSRGAARRVSTSNRKSCGHEVADSLSYIIAKLRQTRPASASRTQIRERMRKIVQNGVIQCKTVKLLRSCTKLHSLSHLYTD